MKNVEDMTFDELVEWSEGHILKELIKGQFHSAVYTVVRIAMENREKQLKKEKKK